MMETTLLETTWFLILGIALAMYAILDGFDLGSGMLYIFASNEDERRDIRNAIGPVWDGNEVWLIAGGGGMFAAFPLAYATIFSSMYFAVILLIWSLILRAVSLEFRGQFNHTLWHRIWDGAFILGSFLPALLLGVALGNILEGLNIDNTQFYRGTFLDLLNPFALIIGLFVVFLFVTHGASYLIARTEGHLQETMKSAFKTSWILYLVLFLIANIGMISAQHQLMSNFNDNLVLYIIPVLSLLAILAIWYLNKLEKYFFSFLASTGAILLLMLSVGIAIFPNIVPASNSAFSVSLSQAAASETALTAMTVIALIGLPLVLIYTFLIYRIFVFKKVSKVAGY